MALKKALIGTGGVLAGAAAALAGVNGALSAAAAPLWPVLPGEEKRYSWRDGEIGYAVRGDGLPILLLHGIYATACGFEMRRIFGPLAERHRVYCPDLLGFGLSDRPAMDYTPGTYMQMIRDFAQDVIGEPCIVVASSLTAAYVIQLAYDHPTLFKRLILSAPTGIEQLADNQPSALKDGVNRLIMSSILGEAAFNALVSKPSIRYFLEKQSYYDDALVTDEMLEYYHVSAHQPNARYAPAAFVGQQLAWSVRHPFANLTQPTLIVWGAESPISPVRYAEAFRHANPRARLVIFDKCGAVPHDERGDDYARIALDWLALPDDDARRPVAEAERR